MKKILIKIWQSNPVQGGVVAVIVANLIFAVIILVACVYSLF